MNHETCENLLPLYAAQQLSAGGQLPAADKAAIETHLEACAECRADLELWQAVSTEIRASDRVLAAPLGLAETALDQVRAPGGIALGLLSTWELLRAQARLVQREMWPASASVMGLGVVLALVSSHFEVIYFLAPMIAAAMLATLSGQENDPAYELAVSTPTSPWKVLLARMSIVSAYNLLLTLAATLVLLAFTPPGVLGALALGWLAPMAFLSTLALLLSIWFGSGNAIVIAYVLWVMQYVRFQSISRWMVSPDWESVIAAYQKFWHQPVLLLALSVLMLILALASANRTVIRLRQGTV